MADEIDPATSILVGLKKALGIDASYDAFDMDITMFANGVFSTLHQLGVGPIEGFVLTGPEQTWESYLGETKVMESSKTYLYLRVRLIFDPPQAANTASAYESMAKELEWRLMVSADPKLVDPTEVPDDGDITVVPGN